MLQPATIVSTPVTTNTITMTTTTTTTTPRTPKQNRKSAITLSLQNQNNTNPSGNTANNNNGRQKRNPAHTHARHQSMPAQSRPTLHNPPVPSPTDANKSNNNSTVKRTSASSVIAPAPSPAASGIQILKNHNSQGTTKQNNNSSNEGQRNNQRSRSSGQTQPNNNNNNNNGKNKRNQRRKDAEATADSKADMDTAGESGGSPTLNPSTPPSTDSDDSESVKLEISPRTRPVKGQNSRQNGRTKGYPHLSGSPPQRPNSAPVIPQPRKGIATPQKQSNNGANQRQQQGNFVRKTSFGSASSLPMDGAESKAISVDEFILAAEKKSTLYAGPTFHNSPDPTALPIPAFARPFEAHTEPQVEKLPQPFFGEAALPQLNSMRPQRTQSETTGWMAHQSMPGLSPYQNLNLGWTYQLTERISTTYSSNYSADEMTQSLRTILKIPSQ